MKQFAADRFVSLLIMLGKAELWLQDAAKRTGQHTKLSPKARNVIHEHMNEIDKYCAELGLNLSGAQIQRILEQVGPGSLAKLVRLYRELQQRVTDELKLRFIMQIPLAQAQYYQSPKQLFGELTIRQFPATLSDIEEAGKCYALGRNTASVLHLVRVMEVGLRALGMSLNDPSLDPKRNPTWEALLSKCDKELQKPAAERSSEWRTDDQFFSQATANLRAVKNAWRNPTMHVEISYDADAAEDIFNAVRAFMRHLAQKIPARP